ncbi:MAG: lipopolysaccharide biosynthesis protein [Clostridia bacterium]|nr:lipopolysaccharide biosynthesis protein [Clostridia bacterium]
MINILFSGNEKVFDGILTCVLSIFKRSDLRDRSVRFYILTMDVSHLKEAYTPIPDEHIHYLDAVVKSYSPSSEVVKIDVTDLYKKEFYACPNENAYCSPYTLLRLFADEIPSLPDKILYLDVDIMFNRDIRLLYDIDIEGYEYAAARDHYGKFLIKPNYINAGVLLFNLKYMKQTGILKKARELIKTKKLLFADQSALIRSTTKKKMLPQKFNDQKFLHKSTVVRHFSKRLFYLPYPHVDNIKQWDLSRVHKVFRYYQFDDILYEYIYLKERFIRERDHYE